MKIIKVMNNNVVSALDERDCEIIILGKGIGFQKHSGDVIEESAIEKNSAFWSSRKTSLKSWWRKYHTSI